MVWLVAAETQQVGSQPRSPEADLSATGFELVVALSSERDWSIRRLKDLQMEEPGLHSKS